MKLNSGPAHRLAEISLDVVRWSDAVSALTTALAIVEAFEKE